MKTLRNIFLGLLVTMVLGACQPPPAPAVTPTTDPTIATLKADADQVAANKAVMGKFLELFTTGAWDQFDQVIATDCVLHYPGGVDVVGHPDREPADDTRRRAARCLGSLADRRRHCTDL